MTNPQEVFYNERFDYRSGSPHLKHWFLYERLVGVIRAEITELSTTRCPVRVLEIGAGHGGYTEPVLAAGCHVTAVEMSRHSLDHMTARFVGNPNFVSIYEPDGGLTRVGDGFSLVLCISVLHHIPDYLTFLAEIALRLEPGGTLIMLQDPLWYARLPDIAHHLSRVGYLSWRVRQGNIRRAFATYLRRRRGFYDEENPSDMVEYHVVRKGVDECAVVNLLNEQFNSVQLIRYWSNQDLVVQKLGDTLHLTNTFGVVAIGRE